MNQQNLLNHPRIFYKHSHKIILITLLVLVNVVCFYAKASQEEIRFQELFKKQIIEVLQVITSEKYELYCDSQDDWNQHKIGRTLEDLSKEQERQCSSFLLSGAKEILPLLEKNEIQFEFIESVGSSAGGMIRKRGNIDRSQKIIAVDMKTLNGRKPTELMAAAGQLLYQFAHWEGNSVELSKPAGAFNDSSGGEEFIEAVGYGFAMVSHGSGVSKKYDKKFKASLSTKLNWVELDLQSEKPHVSQEKTSYHFEDRSNLKLVYRRDLEEGSHFGFHIHARAAFANRYRYTDLYYTEVHQGLGLGAHFKVFPFENVEGNYLNSSHFIFDLGYEFLLAKYEVEDRSATSTSLVASDSANSQSPYFYINYLFPLLRNFWISANGGINMHKLNYSKFDVKYDSPVFTYGAGIIYGF